MSDENVPLSRFVSHALRHEPWLYELELDDAGWVPMEDLLAAARGDRPQWRDLTADDVAHMLAVSVKRRYEIDGERIRALYGHSVPERIVRVEQEPPAVLFHGTSPQAWEVIRTSGLAPMRRQYVHLSVDLATAVQVGRRKAAVPVLLRVAAADAHAQGVTFWQGNESVWLTEAVPARFLVVERDDACRDPA